MHHCVQTSSPNTGIQWTTHNNFNTFRCVWVWIFVFWCNFILRLLATPCAIVCFTFFLSDNFKNHTKIEQSLSIEVGWVGWGVSLSRSALVEVVWLHRRTLNITVSPHHNTEYQECISQTRVEANNKIAQLISSLHIFNKPRCRILDTTKSMKLRTLYRYYWGPR